MTPEETQDAQMTQVGRIVHLPAPNSDFDLGLYRRPHPQIREACDIIERLVTHLKSNLKYYDHECPFDAPCRVCQLRDEAGAFVAGNRWE